MAGVDERKNPGEAGPVRVRAETAVVGLGWRQVGEVERDSAVEGAISTGRLVEVDEVDEPVQLRGEALTDALREAGLSTAGTADEKRARLTAGVDGDTDTGAVGG